MISIPSAVLLMDLQRDFLDHDGGRMAVTRAGAASVVDIANQILDGSLLPDTLPILVVNKFPASDRIGNLLRRGSAISGSAGAALDKRIRNMDRATVMEKSRPSAFTNDRLDAFLRGHGTRQIYLLGVFAEGCVRATAVDALERGYKVRPITDAIASDARWKKRFAIWAMKRAGALPLESTALTELTQ